ncbi:MAG: hypothetical protein ACREGC_02730 [Minisyncoccia bacterium]
MITIKVLKRKDGASLVAGVILAIITASFISGITQGLAQKISYSNLNNYAGPSWQVAYLYPIVWFVLELIVVEIAVWIYVGLHDSMK